MKKELQKAADNILEANIDEETVIVIRWNQETGEFDFGMLGLVIGEEDQAMIIEEIYNSINKITQDKTNIINISDYLPN